MSKLPDRRSSAPAEIAPPPSAEELRSLLARLLAGAAGGDEPHWTDLIGEVEKLPTALHPICNWRVVPSGSSAELKAIRHAVDLVRAAHPYARE